VAAADAPRATYYVPIWNSDDGLWTVRRQRFSTVSPAGGRRGFPRKILAGNFVTCIWRVPLDKNEGVVKQHFSVAVFFGTAWLPESWRTKKSGNFTVNHFAVCRVRAVNRLSDYKATDSARRG